MRQTLLQMKRKKPHAATVVENLGVTAIARARYLLGYIASLVRREVIRVLPGDSDTSIHELFVIRSNGIKFGHDKLRRYRKPALIFRRSGPLALSRNRGSRQRHNFRSETPCLKSHPLP